MSNRQILRDYLARLEKSSDDGEIIIVLKHDANGDGKMQSVTRTTNFPVVIRKKSHAETSTGTISLAKSTAQRETLAQKVMPYFTGFFYDDRAGSNHFIPWSRVIEIILTTA